MTFEDRLYEALEEVDDPFDMETIAEVAGTLLGEAAVGVGRVADIGDPTDVLEVTRAEEGVEVKAILNVPIDGWTDNARIVMFSLLHDGFDYIAEHNHFAWEGSIP